MKPSVYIETSVVSYLSAHPSRDIVIAAHQQITYQWWLKRSRFRLYASQFVIREASSGDSEAASARLGVLKDITLLPISDESSILAEKIYKKCLPAKAEVDAFHIAIAVVNGMDYLLTWNCSHIANASNRGKIERLCRESGFEPPVICTPEELMEDNHGA